MLTRLERALEQMVEGSLAGLFRLRVQPAEIGRQLERAMLDGRTAGMGTQLAPNAFTVRLHPDDAGAFAGWEDALAHEMEVWLAELAYARGLATVAPIRVRVLPDPAVPRRAVRASGAFAGAGSAPGEPQPRDAAPLWLRAVTPGIVDGALRSAVVTVGRAGDNDLVLPDPEVSRHHARLEREGNAWRVVDLGSANGTWVNGTRIRQATVDVGDSLAFAGVRMTITSE